MLKKFLSVALSLEAECAFHKNSIYFMEIFLHSPQSSVCSSFLRRIFNYFPNAEFFGWKMELWWGVQEENGKTARKKLARNVELLNNVRLE